MLYVDKFQFLKKYNLLLKNEDKLFRIQEERIKQMYDDAKPKKYRKVIDFPNNPKK